MPLLVMDGRKWSPATFISNGRDYIGIPPNFHRRRSGWPQMDFAMEVTVETGIFGPCE